MTAESRPILAEYARAGWSLVPIPLGRKGPVGEGWNKRDLCIRDPEIAEWLDGNVGLAHAYSGTCAVDVDDMEKATAWLKARGVDLGALLGAPDAVRIESRPGHAKLLYRLASPLPSFNLGGLEFRCGTANQLTVQDVLPPSIHPDTGKPYTWLYNAPDGHWSALPPIAPEVLTLWQALVSAKAERPKTPTKANRATVADSPRLRALLARLDPNATYPEWLAVGMALHHETGGSDAGLGLWNAWSADGTRLAADGSRVYKGIGDLETHWRSFKVDHDRPITLASLRTESAAESFDFPDLSIVPAAERKAPAGLMDPQRAESPGSAREKALEGLRSVRRNKVGTIEARISNIVAVLGVPEVAGADLSYDEFQDAIMTSPKGGAEWRLLEDTDYTQMRVWLETAGNCEPIPHDMITRAAHLVAQRNKMDTAQMWLESLTWDGVPRIERFCPEYFGTHDTPYTRAVGLYLWTALAGRVAEPGCQADMVPVLIGRQGVGKSRGVQALVPSPEHYVEVRLDEPDDAIARKCRGVLVGELAEMRGLRAADIERVKAFITRTQERWVPKYREFATNYSRRFIIVGTTNDEEFLPTDTEHRRWLPMHTQKVAVNRISEDREQLWAEGLVRFTVDGIHWSGMDSLAAEARALASGEDPWETQIVMWLRENPIPHLRMSDIMSNAIGIDSRMATRTHELRVAKSLRALGYERVTMRVDGRVQKMWAKA